MIVIMRDAVMPECCNTCVCSEGYGCGITGTEMTTKEMESRPDWCPLEEVESCDDAVSREAVSSWLKQYGQDVLHGKYKFSLMYIWKNLMDLPSVQPETNCSEIPNNSDAISRQQALEAIRTMQTYKLFAGDDMLLIDQAEAQTELMMMPSVQPERKDAIEKAVAVEAISDELMSRFDVSATYGYDFAEAVINRMEVMAKELEGGKQE